MIISDLGEVEGRSWWCAGLELCRMKRKRVGPAKGDKRKLREHILQDARNLPRYRSVGMQWRMF